MTTYEKIKTLRKQKRLSQDELARLTGYTDRSSIAKIEAGKVDLTESKIVVFAQALGVSPSYLMGLTEEVPKVSEDDIKAAFWGGERDLSQEEIDALWAETKDYIAFRTAQRKKKKK